MGQSPGTMWYHAHKHGSTAIDVSNGMVGAFIIEDNSPQGYDGLHQGFLLEAEHRITAGQEGHPSTHWPIKQTVMVVNQFARHTETGNQNAGRPQAVLDQRSCSCRSCRCIQAKCRCGASSTGRRSAVSICRQCRRASLGGKPPRTVSSSTRELSEPSTTAGVRRGGQPHRPAGSGTGHAGNTTLFTVMVTRVYRKAVRKRPRRRQRR